MARRFWDSEFAGHWFGFRNSRDLRVRRPLPPRPRGAPDLEAESPGIVERNRRARREKWALRTTR